MNQPNSLTKFEYILEADTTLCVSANVPVTYLNARKWYDFKIKANKSKLKHNENIYFSLKLEFLSQKLDEIDWILWDKWAQNNSRPRAIEIEPQSNISIIYDKHECNLVGLVANRIDKLNLKLRFNCASSHFPPRLTENTVAGHQDTTFRLVIESFSDESGSKFDCVTCLIKLFEHESAHRQFQVDQFHLVRNYVEILNPLNASRNSQNIMNNSSRSNEKCEKNECVSVLNQFNNNLPSLQVDNKITINIFYLYINDKNYTSMPFPLTFNVSLTVEKLKEKLFLPLIQKNVGNNYLRIENIYFRELKYAFDKHSSITLTDMSIPKVFKHNCGYKLELVEIKRSHHRGGKHHQTKPKVLYEITNSQIGSNIEKYVTKNVHNICNNFEHLRQAKSTSKEQYYNLYIIECFIV